MDETLFCDTCAGWTTHHTLPSGRTRCARCGSAKRPYLEKKTAMKKKKKPSAPADYIRYVRGVLWAGGLTPPELGPMMKQLERERDIRSWSLKSEDERQLQELELERLTNPDDFFEAMSAWKEGVPLTSAELEYAQRWEEEEHSHVHKMNEVMGLVRSAIREGIPKPIEQVAAESNVPEGRIYGTWNEFHILTNSKQNFNTGDRILIANPQLKTGFFEHSESKHLRTEAGPSVYVYDGGQWGYLKEYPKGVLEDLVKLTQQGRVSKEEVMKALGIEPAPAPVVNIPPPEEEEDPLEGAPEWTDEVLERFQRTPAATVHLLESEGAGLQTLLKLLDSDHEDVVDAVLLRVPDQHLHLLMDPKHRRKVRRFAADRVSPEELEKYVNDEQIPVRRAVARRTRLWRQLLDDKSSSVRLAAYFRAPPEERVDLLLQRFKDDAWGTALDRQARYLGIRPEDMHRLPLDHVTALTEQMCKLSPVKDLERFLDHKEARVRLVAVPRATREQLESCIPEDDVKVQEAMEARFSELDAQERITMKAMIQSQADEIEALKKKLKSQKPEPAKPTSLLQRDRVRALYLLKQKRHSEKALARGMFGENTEATEHAMRLVLGSLKDDGFVCASELHTPHTTFRDYVITAKGEQLLKKEAENPSTVQFIEASWVSDPLLPQHVSTKTEEPEAVEEAKATEVDESGDSVLGAAVSGAAAAVLGHVAGDKAKLLTKAGRGDAITALVEAKLS